MTAVPVPGVSLDDASLGDDSDPFVLLARHQLDAAYRMAWAILGSEHDAQDATQHVFTVIWRRRAAADDLARLEAWLWRLLLKDCRDRLNHRAKDDPHRIEAIATPPFSEARRVIVRHDGLNRALARLDADVRIAIVLRYWAGLSVEEIATRLAVPAAKVRGRLDRGTALLRQRIEAES